MISLKLGISSLLVLVLLVSSSSASLSSTSGFLHNRRDWNIALSTATIATVAASTNACNLGWLFNRKHSKDSDDGGNEDLISGHHLHRDPLLQIPCGLIIVDGDDSSSGNDFNDIPPEQIHPLSTYVDTGIAHTIITYEAAKRTGLLSLLPSSSSSKTKDGIQIIPEGSIWFRMGSEEATVLAPELHVLPPSNDRSKKARVSSDRIPSKELILGLDFLRKYQTVIDLHDDELRIVVKLNNGNNQQVDDNKEGGVGENVADSVVVMIPLIRPRPVLDFGTPDL